MFWQTHPSGQWTNITCINEFAAGHNDDCGPNANYNLRTTLLGQAQTASGMDWVRSRDIALNHFSAGQTINDVYWDMQTFGGVGPVTLSPFKSGLLPYTFTELVTIFEQVPALGHATGFVVEIAAAHNLPFNEPNVDVHFIAVLGYDTDATPGTPKVLIANGDRVPIPGGTGKPDWLTVQSLEDSVPIGLVRVEVPPKYWTQTVTHPIDTAGIIADAQDIIKKASA